LADQIRYRARNLRARRGAARCDARRGQVRRYTADVDSLITAAARALALGDPLCALNHVALRNDPPALALRGIAMAQLEQPTRARELLRAAARGFGAQEARARARCIVAEAEVALASRDLGRPTRTLVDAAAVLERTGDRSNALHARLILVRRALLLGRLADATALLGELDLRAVAPPHAAIAELARAEIALRGVHTRSGRAALARAERAARRSRIPALLHEVARLRDALEQPAARELLDGTEHALRLDEVETLLHSRALVLDVCQRSLRRGARVVALARRPVLFALARALCERWPEAVERDVLIAGVFEVRRVNESHRVRLRVELSRLRQLCGGIARIEATASGFGLVPVRAPGVRVLLPPVEGEQGALLALLADGQAWSSSALATALGESQRNVQRALAELLADGRVYAIGAARARRWLCTARTGITTTLLLPTALAAG
jgi:hypothetical protein